MMCQFCGLYGCDEMCQVDVASCATCPADDYLTTLRIMAQEVQALEEDLDLAHATLRKVLDYVRWDAIPEDLCADVDAVLDGNTEDESPE